MEQNLSSDERKKILLDIADALEQNEDLIRTENEADVSAAQDAGYQKSLVDRLTLKPEKVALVYISAYLWLIDWHYNDDSILVPVPCIFICWIIVHFFFFGFFLSSD
jgi:hypothetical protein